MLSLSLGSLRLTLLLVASLAGAVGCQRDDAADPPTIRVSGASTLYPVVQLAGEELRRQGKLEVNAQAGGSTRGFEDTMAGRNDLGAMARELTPDEKQNVSVHPIAYDGVGIVVHRTNPLTGVSTEQLNRIYRKQIKNWRELGGSEGEIVVVTKAEGHATLETFLQHTGVERSELKADVVAGDNAQVIRVVANTASSIGYVSLGEAMYSMEIDMPLRLIKLDGIEPTLKSVADHEYPMFRTLYLVSKGELSPGSRTLLEFLGSEEGRRVIEQGKYVPLGEDTDQHAFNTESP